jgi:hypothetical protein
MRCSDGGYYVIKFANNPQGARILTNELLGVQLASALHLPVASGHIIAVSPLLIRESTQMVMQHRIGSFPCNAGLCYGSLYQGDPLSGTTLDDLSPIPINQIENVRDFFGFLVFDIWTGNSDSRQIVLVRADHALQFQAAMIDQGDCFRRDRWDFHDHPKCNLYAERAVYSGLQGIDGFEPWLSALETRIDRSTLFKAARAIPRAWYESDSKSLLRLLNELNSRRNRVRSILWSLRHSCPHIFPNWNSAKLADSTLRSAPWAN